MTDKPVKWPEKIDHCIHTSIAPKEWLCTNCEEVNDAIDLCLAAHAAKITKLPSVKELIKIMDNPPMSKYGAIKVYDWEVIGVVELSTAIHTRIQQAIN